MKKIAIFAMPFVFLLLCEVFHWMSKDQVTYSTMVEVLPVKDPVPTWPEHVIWSGKEMAYKLDKYWGCSSSRRNLERFGESCVERMIWHPRSPDFVEFYLRSPSTAKALDDIKKILWSLRISYKEKVEKAYERIDGRLKTYKGLLPDNFDFVYPEKSNLSQREYDIIFKTTAFNVAHILKMKNDEVISVVREPQLVSMVGQKNLNRILWLLAGTLLSLTIFLFTGAGRKNE